MTPRGVASAIQEWEYQEWCREKMLDPEDVGSMLEYEEEFDPTDDYIY